MSDTNETPVATPAPIPGPWLVFEADVDARNAVLAISRTMGLGRYTTSFYTVPVGLPDGRSAVIRPGDDAYLADVSGFTDAAEITPADGQTAPELFVPGSVSLAQARAVLLQTPGPDGTGTMFDTVNAALTAGKNGTVAQRTAFQAWEFSNNVTRKGALVQSLSAQFGLTESDLDRLFREAAQIQF